MGEGAGQRIVRDYVNVFPERLGVIIGNRGKVKREIEERTGVRLIVDSSSSSVIIELDTSKCDFINLLKAKNIVLAVSYGFSPEKAFRLLDEDQVFDIIDLTQYGDSKNSLARIKGRIIGERGKTRRIVEEYTGVYLSIYENYVAIIGDYEHVVVARHAVQMLANGAQHRTVYNYLQRERRRLRRMEFELWRRP